MVIGPPSSAILRYARVVVDVGRHPSGLGAGGLHWYSDATALLTVYQIRDIERLASEQPEVSVEVLSILGDRPDTRTAEEQRVAAEFYANNLDLVREVNADLGYPGYPPEREVEWAPPVEPGPVEPAPDSEVEPALPSEPPSDAPGPPEHLPGPPDSLPGRPGDRSGPPEDRGPPPGRGRPSR